MPTSVSSLSFPTQQISPDTLYLAGIATLISGFQLGAQAGSFARRVGLSRRKYKVDPPFTESNENFLRCFRAQQNCLEFYPIFLVATWTAAVFFHQIPAAVMGVYYMFEREKYFTAYTANAESRRKPFYNSTNALRILSFLGALGLFNVVIRQLFGRDLLQTIADGLQNPSLT